MKNLNLSLLFAILIFSLKLSSQSVVLSMPDTLVNNGDVFTFPLHLVYSGTDVATIQFDVVFDPTVINAVGCAVASNLFGACNPAYPDTLKYGFFNTVGPIPNDTDVCFTDFEVVGDHGSQTQIQILNLQAWSANNTPVPINIISFEGGLVQVDCLNTLIILSGDDYFAGDVVKREAHQSILAFNTINSGANITYDAGLAINLQNGFRVLLGAQFKTQHDGCFGQ